MTVPLPTPDLVNKITTTVHMSGFTMHDLSRTVCEMLNEPQPREPQPRLADRHWTRSALVRITRDIPSGMASPPDGFAYREGETTVMWQWGGPGQPPDLTSWWSQINISGAYILDSTDVEVIETLIDGSPYYTYTDGEGQ